MTDTFKKMFGPSNPGTSSGTLYTSPAGGAVLRNLHVQKVNSNGTETLSIGINGSATVAANQFFSAYNFVDSPNQTWDWDGFLVLPAGYTVRAAQATAGDLIIFGSGVEFSSTSLDGGAKLMYGPAQPGVADGVLYTSPSAGAIVRNVHVTNTDTVDRWVSLAVDGSANFNTNCWFYQLSLGPSACYDFKGMWMLDGTKALHAMQESATACTVTISGVEL